MPGLGTSLGFGAATNPPRDLVNSDCILIMGSNMAESHPVGFNWPVVAQQRGAVLIHVDPRFTRTSALCNIHAPIRSGTDIAFLGGIIHQILERDLWFRGFAMAYTNIANITGNPAISLPAGSSENGVPFGLHVTAPGCRESYIDDRSDGVEEPGLDGLFNRGRCLRRHAMKHVHNLLSGRSSSALGAASAFWA